MRRIVRFSSLLRPLDRFLYAASKNNLSPEFGRCCWFRKCGLAVTESPVVR